MILKHYSKMALIVVAAASLAFAGCGVKKDDSAMSSSMNKSEMSSAQMEADAAAKAKADAAAKAKAEADAAAKAKMAAKPSTNAVYFAFDSAKIDSAGAAIIGEYATWLKANPDVKVTVEGNCDERGSREYNLALGEERAKSVRNVLLANGVADTRVNTVSFGEERPVCTRSGEACWAQNRHGDIVNR